MNKDKMNEEELFCKLFPEYTVNGKSLSPYFDLFESGYEQSENRIEELKLKLEALEGQTPWKDIKDKSELIKENAQLKKEWQEQVQKATDEGYARTLQTIQLTKATEIIKNLIQREQNELGADIKVIIHQKTNKSNFLLGRD